MLWLTCMAEWRKSGRKGGIAKREFVGAQCLNIFRILKKIDYRKYITPNIGCAILIDPSGAFFWGFHYKFIAKVCLVICSPSPDSLY